MTASTCALVWTARLILDRRARIAYEHGPLAAHWAWRAALWVAREYPREQWPERVLAELDGPMADGVDWPAWELARAVQGRGA